MHDYSDLSMIPDRYDDYSHLLMMPEDQLERMYPRVYYIVNPIVIRQCDYMDDTYGPDYIPTREELERMIDSIYSQAESRVMAEMPAKEKHGNPDGNPDGNPFLRGLVGTLLVRELFRPQKRKALQGDFRDNPDFSPGFPPFFPIWSWFFPLGFNVKTGSGYGNHSARTFLNTSSRLFPGVLTDRRGSNRSPTFFQSVHSVV